MIKIAFSLLLVIHSLLHLIGFLNGEALAKIKIFNGNNAVLKFISGSGKVAWIVASIILTTTMLFYITGKSWWWMPAAVGVILSQALIIIYWPEAKYGTFVNIIVIGAILLSYGSWNFQSTVDKETISLLNNSSFKGTASVTPDNISNLPPVVQHWLIKSGVVGKNKIKEIYLKQEGMMRTEPDGKWMPVEAEQYFTTEPPGFIWKANITAAPFIHIAGRDKFMNGHGNMLIRLMNIIPVADSRGPEIDQGTLLRYLAEIIWFPSAALQDYIRWDSIDATSALATITCNSTSACGIFKFSPSGEVLSFQARRYGEFNGEYTLENWLVEIKEHKRFHGINIPYTCEVTWQFEDHDFTWYKFKVTGIKYDLNELTAKANTLR